MFVSLNVGFYDVWSLCVWPYICPCNLISKIWGCVMPLRNAHLSTPVAGQSFGLFGPHAELVLIIFSSKCLSITTFLLRTRRIWMCCY